MIKTNLFWVVPHQLTQSVPTLKSYTHKSLKKRGVRGQFDLKKPLKSSNFLPNKNIPQIITNKL
jgi:hypothetical protein